MSVDPRRRPLGPRLQRGLTLVELIVSLVLAAVLLGAMWNAWSLMGRGSADPMVSRQQLAIAQSLLREIELQPLPGSTGGAAANTPGRTGYASISDYNGLTMDGITDAEGVAINGLGAYGARVTVASQAISGVPAGSGWWVTVTVTGPDTRPLVLGQWRSAR